MKRIIVLTTLAIVCGMAISCKENEIDCDEMNLDFAYSIGYPTDSLSATVQFNNTTDGFPTDGTINWTVNGESAFVNGTEVIFYQNGAFNITMYYDYSGQYCTVTKDFMITGIKPE